MKTGDKVQIQYIKDKPQKQLLTLIYKEWDEEDKMYYWKVKERVGLIPERILIKVK